MLIKLRKWLFLFALKTNLCIIHTTKMLKIFKTVKRANPILLLLRQQEFLVPRQECDLLGIARQV